VLRQIGSHLVKGALSSDLRFKKRKAVIPLAKKAPAFSHSGEMNCRLALQRLDFERRTIHDVDVNLETIPYVVRAISKLSFWNGIVYSHFPRSIAEAAGSIARSSQPESNMPGDSIRFVILKLMYCPLAGRSWRDTGSRGWVPPGRRIRRQRTSHLSAQCEPRTLSSLSNFGCRSPALP
jgi:hypothetical protein